MANFYFLDGIHADKGSKRRMRSHVMKGKNAGKRLHRPSKLDHGNIQSLPKACTLQSIILRNSNPFLLSISGPVVPSLASLKIINDFYAFTADRIYPTKLGISLDHAKAMWLRGLFEDQASYNCSVGLMQACNEIYINDGSSSQAALFYLNQTFTHVRERLNSDQALSDSTLRIVLALINQEQIRQQDAAAEVHFRGLAALVKLRGGLAQLENNLPLVLKICKTDIIFALRNGGPTIYFRDQTPKFRLLLGKQERYCEASTYLRKLYRPNHPLCQAFSEVMNMCSLFNDDSNSCPMDLETMQEIIISLVCRLLRYRALIESRQKADIQSAYHLGLIICIMTMFLQHDVRRMLEYELISSCLRDILERQSENLEDDFALWLMLIGGIWTQSEAETNWLTRMLRGKARKLGLRTWDDAQPALLKYPWITVLHHMPGRRIWQLSCCNC